MSVKNKNKYSLNQFDLKNILLMAGGSVLVLALLFAGNKLLDKSSDSKGKSESSVTTPERSNFTLEEETNLSTGSAPEFDLGLVQTEETTETSTMLDALTTEETALASSEVTPETTVAGEPFDFTIYNTRPAYMSNEEILAGLTIGEDGRYQVYPIRRDNYEKIPYVGLDILENTASASYIRALSPERILVNLEGEEREVTLIGIEGQSHAVAREQQMDYMDVILDADIGGCGLVLEVLGETESGDILAWVWVEREDSQQLELLQERMLIDGYVQPMETPQDDKYWNWLIQYPNLYDLES